MRKGIFIPDITVEMFKNASLEAVEELLVSGTMEDIEIPDRPHGEWEWITEDRYRCTNCNEIITVKEVMNEPQYITCPMCDAKMGEGEAE